MAYVIYFLKNNNIQKITNRIQGGFNMKRLLLSFACLFAIMGTISKAELDAINKKDRKELLLRIREIHGVHERGVEWHGSAKRANMHLRFQNDIIEKILKKYHIEFPQKRTWKWLDNLQQECAKIKYESTAISLEKFAQDGKCSYCTLENIDLREIVTSLNER